MPRFDPVTLRKRCPHCRRDLRLAAFNRSRSMPDGYQGYCRRCQRAAHERWWLAHPERDAEYNARRRATPGPLSRDREKPCSCCAQPFIAPAGRKRWTCDNCQREAQREYRRQFAERRRRVA